jgi:hypothetical protein
MDFIRPSFRQRPGSRARYVPDGLAALPGFPVPAAALQRRARPCLQVRRLQWLSASAPPGCCAAAIAGDLTMSPSFLISACRIRMADSPGIRVGGRTHCLSGRGRDGHAGGRATPISAGWRDSHEPRSVAPIRRMSRSRRSPGACHRRLRRCGARCNHSRCRTRAGRAAQALAGLISIQVWAALSPLLRRPYPRRPGLADTRG